jgi:subtilase family serine protease
VRCHAQVHVDQNGDPLVSKGPSSYGPTFLWGAYGLGGAVQLGGVGQTIAVVDAFDDPNAEADLGAYRSYFGFAPCTTANGCFRKVNQRGGTTYPHADRGWAEEISLDVDMASAICPNCDILLVEADSSALADLAAGVDTATHLGATVISNSYGGPEYAGEVADESHYNHPGIAITVSSGDGGYGVEFPAASQYVTAVGGTTLTRTLGRYSETAWSGSGSGCSRYIHKPTWQHDTGCSNRTVADVAADGDPNTGVAVYDTYRMPGGGGWLKVGGTSVSAPIIAGVYALAGNAATVNYGSFSYSHLSACTM